MRWSAGLLACALSLSLTAPIVEARRKLHLSEVAGSWAMVATTEMDLELPGECVKFHVGCHIGSNVTSPYFTVFDPDSQPSETKPSCLGGCVPDLKISREVSIDIASEEVILNGAYFLRPKRTGYTYLVMVMDGVVRVMAKDGAYGKKRIRKIIKHITENKAMAYFGEPAVCKSGPPPPFCDHRRRLQAGVSLGLE